MYYNKGDLRVTLICYFYSMSDWEKAQEFESSWWDNCTNTLGEELKQLEYAKRMELKFVSKYGQVFIETDKSIVDIGGGPVSMLLKATPNKDVKRLVIDPVKYPDWVYTRYDVASIEYGVMKGEDYRDITRSVSKGSNIIFYKDKFDECWIYNCLQHTQDPRKIIENAKNIAKTIRIFEWLEIPTDQGHIHTLHKSDLDDWLGQEGKTEELNTNALRGLSYYNVITYP